MALFLLELEPQVADREAASRDLDRLAGSVEEHGGEVLEATVTGDHRQAFVVASAEGVEPVADAARASGLTVHGPDPVRLVGATEDEVRAARGGARFLVEWDFPTGLSMDAYLERKKERSPRYAEVPEVSFLRTYVREDMTKCLCLYDAQSEADVRRAREIVETPVTRLHELGEAGVAGRAG